MMRWRPSPTVRRQTQHTTRRQGRGGGAHARGSHREPTRITKEKHDHHHQTGGALTRTARHNGRPQRPKRRRHWVRWSGKGIGAGAGDACGGAGTGAATAHLRQQWGGGRGDVGGVARPGPPRSERRGARLPVRALSGYQASGGVMGAGGGGGGAPPVVSEGGREAVGTCPSGPVRPRGPPLGLELGQLGGACSARAQSQELHRAPASVRSQMRSDGGLPLVHDEWWGRCAAEDW